MKACASFVRAKTVLCLSGLVTTIVLAHATGWASEAGAAATEPDLWEHRARWFHEQRAYPAEDIPDGATVRVTAEVKIFGRFMGKGKADGWFLSRLSQDF